MSAMVSTPLLAPGSPLDERARKLVRELHERERQSAPALPSDDPLDPKRRRRVELTRTEIWAQPEAIRTTLKAEMCAIKAAAAHFAKSPLRRLYLAGCGDSLAATIAVRALLEEVLGVACEPVQALDLAYYNHRPLDSETLLVAVSSSGETTRTIEALLMARALGARTLAVSNSQDSPLMTEADFALRVHAERKGWPTQASTAALALIAQFGLDLSHAQRGRGVPPKSLQAALDAVPAQIAETLERHDDLMARIAEREAGRRIYLFSGGGPAFGAALFGAAKVKECSPDHGIAIPLEEFHHYNSQKHGDPLFLVAPEGRSLSRARDTALEGRRWGGTIYAVTTEGDDSLDDCADEIIALPAVPEVLAPLVYAVPLQLFAYHVAQAKFRRAEAAARG